MACRFGTNGLAMMSVSDQGNTKVLDNVQVRLEVNITDLPEEIECAHPLTRRSDQKWKDGRSAYLPACLNVPAHSPAEVTSYGKMADLPTYLPACLNVPTNSPAEATRNGKMVHYEVMHMQPCLLFRHHHHK